MHAQINGNKACGWAVVSIRKTIEVSIALEAPANIAAIPIKAAVAMFIPLSGNICNTIIPSKAPVAPPIVNKGANVPPDVPLLNAITHEVYFRKHKISNILSGKAPVSKLVIFE